MTTTVRDLMTPNPLALSSHDSITDAARAMRDIDAGDVLVLDDGDLCGIVTDRDIVTAAVADGRDLDATTLSEICSRDLITLKPDDEAGKAVSLMREHAIRRLPVVDGTEPVGIVSLGDLALKFDGSSVLAQISGAAPDQQ